MQLSDHNESPSIPNRPRMTCQFNTDGERARCIARDLKLLPGGPPLRLARRPTGRQDGRTAGPRDPAGPGVARLGRLPCLPVPCRHKASINPAAVRRLNVTADERDSSATGAGPPIKSGTRSRGTISGDHGEGRAAGPLMCLVVGGHTPSSRGQPAQRAAVTMAVPTAAEPVDSNPGHMSRKEGKF